ncbi:MAG: hypothetical protein RJQ09_08030 [Cyclobacteriaceae bacterium]
MKYLAFPVIVLLIVSCGEDKKALRQARFDEVMAVHDEVMPEMGTIRKLQKDILAKAELISVEDSTGSAQNDLQVLAQELEAANESMMDWMREFSDPGEDIPHEEAMSYYEDQLKKVTEVKRSMLEAIEKGKAVE